MGYLGSSRNWQGDIKIVIVIVIVIVMEIVIVIAITFIVTIQLVLAPMPMRTPARPVWAPVLGGPYHGGGPGKPGAAHI